MNRRSVASRIWNETPVPVFQERFLIALCAVAFWGIAINDVLKIDIQYRIGIAIVLVGLAWMLSYSVYKHNQKPKDFPPGEKKTAESPLSQKSEGANSPNISTGDNSSVTIQNRPLPRFGKSAKNPCIR